ncbi:MAG: hypothetical protein ACPL1B_08675, partial [Thermoprotei archaeon]
ALYMNIPMILSMTNTLYTIFQKAGIFAKNSDEIVDFILELYENYDKLFKYKEQIKLLCTYYKRIHEKQVAKLIELVNFYLH